MLRTDKSVGLPTGMIIAGLYVILLVGFSRESYVRRPYLRRDAVSLVDACSGGTVVDDVPKRACRIERSVQATLLGDGEQRNCLATIDVVRQTARDRVQTLTLDGIRSAIAEPPR